MEQLDSISFRTKVFDYEKSTEWKYLGDKPAIIDFYADWCGPCKAVAPILEQLEKDYEGKIIIYKVNTESDNELSSVFGIRSIPTFLFIPMEGQPNMASGSQPKANFVKFINEVLKVQ